MVNTISYLCVCTLYYLHLSYSIVSHILIRLLLYRSDPTENDSVEGLRPNARGPGLVTFGVSFFFSFLFLPFFNFVCAGFFQTFVFIANGLLCTHCNSFQRTYF